MKTFQQTQLDFARYLRAPDEHPLPAAMDAQRMEIYRNLVFNNIENLVVSVFPVLRSVLSDQQWNDLVRQFIRDYRCQTPYFLEISEEFLRFITHTPQLLVDYPFAAELAHYEWVELALDVSESQLPESIPVPNDIFAATFFVSPLAVALHYQYPVHKISPQFKTTIREPVELVIYRNRADKVRFMIINTLTSRLLYLMHVNAGVCLRELLSIITDELQHPDPMQLTSEAGVLVKALCELDVVSPVT